MLSCSASRCSVKRANFLIVSNDSKLALLSLSFSISFWTEIKEEMATEELEDEEEVEEEEEEEEEEESALSLLSTSHKSSFEILPGPKSLSSTS